MICFKFFNYSELEHVFSLLQITAIILRFLQELTLLRGAFVDGAFRSAKQTCFEKSFFNS